MLAAITSLLWAGAVIVQPTNTDCPSEQAITAELDHLGVLAALAELGSPEVTVEGTKMRVVFHGRDGSMLGVREVAAPTTCQERASIAAVFIAAWVGDWPVPLTIKSPQETGAMIPATTAVAPPSAGMVGRMDPGVLQVPRNTDGANDPKLRDARLTKTESPPPVPPAASPPAERTAPAQPLPPTVKKSVTPTRLAQGRPRAEVAGWALATNDRNAATFGGGLFAGYRFARQIAVAALFEATGEREIAVGPAVATYRPYRLGVGVSVLRTWRLIFLDAGIFPELTMLTASGSKLQIGKSVTTWGAELDLRVRLGFSIGRIAPFFFMGGSGALLAHRLTLDDNPKYATLSRWSMSAGVGLAFLFGRNE